MLAFALAIELIVGALGVLVFRDAWLPACLGLAMGALFVRVFRSDSRKWVVPFALAYFGCVLLAWSFPAVPTEPGQWHAEAFQALLGLIAVVAAVLTFRGLAGADTKPLGWMCPIFAMGVFIAFLSSKVGGAGPMIEWLVNHGCTNDQAHTITFIFRKSGHFTYYGALGIAGTFAAQRIFHVAARAAQIGLAVVFLTASFDELRQSTQVGRTGSAYDVMLDMAGALVFIYLALWTQRKQKRSQNR